MKYSIAFVSFCFFSITSYCQTHLKSTRLNDAVATAEINDMDDIKNARVSDYSVENKFKARPMLFKKYPIKSLPTTDKVYIDFVGTGDIQKSISEGKDINANTGIGIIFERYHDTHSILQSFEFESYLNIFTTADTIVAELSNNELMNRRSFSTYLLNPVSAKQSVYLNTNLYFGYPNKSDVSDDDPIKISDLKAFGKFATVVSGLNARFIASNNVWKVNDTIRSLGGLYARIGLFHEFINDNYRVDENKRSKYSCFIGLNYSFRGMYGDLSSKGNAGIRKRFLGTDKRSFSGLELNFGLRLNNIRAEFQMPVLSGKKDEVQGLTNTQFLFSIKFVGGFALKLKGETGQPGQHE